MTTKKKKKLSVYLAGSIEKSKDLGAGWRNQITPILEDKYGLEVLNPLDLEMEQLQGLQPHRLPETLETKDGKTIVPTYWHDLQHAKDTRLYGRFLKYMRRVIKYDINLVRNESDYVIVKWDEATSKGAGTHAEVTEAFLRNVPVLIVEEHTLPAWIRGSATEIFRSMEELHEFLKEELGE